MAYPTLPDGQPKWNERFLCSHLWKKPGLRSNQKWQRRSSQNFTKNLFWHIDRIWRRKLLSAKRNLSWRCGSYQRQANESLIWEFRRLRNFSRHEKIFEFFFRKIHFYGFLDDHLRDHKSPDSKSSSLSKQKSSVFKSHNDRKIGFKSTKSKKKIVLWNGVTVFDDSEIKKKLKTVVSRWKNLWNEKDFIVKISKSAHMSIDLKSNWADHHKINRVYSVGVKNQKFIDEIFDKFHKQSKMKWSNNSIFFEYFVFVMWKIVIKNEKSVRKNQIVVNIRDLNQITQIDAYSMSVQTNIIVAVSECSHIFIINAQNYFYQWTVREKNRYKQTIIIHRGQEQFNVIIMKFKNFSIYVQKQTDFMLKNFRDFVKTYIDDIVFFFMSLNEHVKHLEKNFLRLSK